MTAPVLTIDVKREIQTLSTKQRLNQVHHTVGLLRLAAEHEPGTVRIRTRGSAFVLEHDGAPLDDAHLTRLERVLGSSDDVDRQQALVELERNHGLLLLSLVVSGTDVTFEGPQSFVARNGTLDLRPGKRPRGFRITIRRPRRLGGEERKELEFYALYATFQVFVDGRSMRRERKSTALVSVDWSERETVGEIGLDTSRPMSQILFYKHGIYFGVRSSRARDGWPLTSWVDVRVAGHEENFRRSLKTADAAMLRHRNTFFERLAEDFSQRSARTREHIRRVFLAAATSPGPLARAPMFPLADGVTSVSLRTLRRWADAEGRLSFATRRMRTATRTGFESLPVWLGAREVIALGRRLATTFQVVQQPRIPRWRRFAWWLQRLPMRRRGRVDEHTGFSAPRPGDTELLATLRAPGFTLTVVKNSQSRAHRSPAGMDAWVDENDEVWAALRAAHAALPGRGDLLRDLLFSSLSRRGRVRA